MKTLKKVAKSLTGKNLKTTLLLLHQVIADVESATQSSNLQLLYERMLANAEDIENFLTHPQRNLFNKRLVIKLKKESEKM